MSNRNTPIELETSEGDVYTATTGDWNGQRTITLSVSDPADDADGGHLLVFCSKDAAGIIQLIQEAAK